MDDAMRNPMAQAWLDAAADLGIRVVHPFAFVTKAGQPGKTCGVYLPDFGSPLGTVLACRFDSDDVEELLDDTEYLLSGLNPRHYEPYSRETFVRALNDWGWFGLKEHIPTWFSGGIRKHGGS